MILIHPILVHFPIAFYALELLLLTFWVWKKDEAYGRFALFVFRIGFLTMAAAAIAGLYDAGGISGITGKVKPHAFAAFSVILIYIIRAFFWKFGKKDKSGYFQIQIASSVLGNLLIAVTGYFGGILVYG